MLHGVRQKLPDHFFIFLISLVFVCMSACHDTANNNNPKNKDQASTYSTSKTTSGIAPEPIIRTLTVDKGDSIYSILTDNGVPDADIYEIVSEARKYFDLSKILPAHEIVLTFSGKDQSLLRLEYEISEIKKLIINIHGKEINVTMKKRNLILPADFTGRLKVFSCKLKKGESVYKILSGLSVSPFQIEELSKSARSSFALSGVKPGHELDVWITESMPVRIARLEYQIDDFRKLIVTPMDGSFTSEIKDLKVEIGYARTHGIIEDNLYDSGIKAGLSPEVIMSLADIFAWDINFFKEIRPGDCYTVVFEKYYVEGKFKGFGKIIAARFINQGKEHVAIYFDDGNGKKGYYDEQGRPIRKMFLKAPLKYARISSTFNYHRLHPILHVWRPHLGVDYAAPMGTPVVALGDGRVIYKGWIRGYGNSIRIRHRNNYCTYYAHLSRYARGIVKGKYVHQGQVIGYVGMTGLATGPHLDFRVRHNGRFVNPLRIKPVAGPPLKGKDLVSFKHIAAERLAMLEDKSLNVAMGRGKRGL